MRVTEYNCVSLNNRYGLVGSIKLSNKVLLKSIIMIVLVDRQPTIINDRLLDQYDSLAGSIR